MPWNVNVPAANLTISSTTAPIQGNFQAIQTWTAVDHIVIDGAGGNEGKHAKVSLIQQVWVAGGGFTPAINLATGRGTLGIFAALDPANGNVPSRMWAVIPRKTAAAWEIANIPFTESTILFNQPANNSSGYTWLPSGILIQYGSMGVNLTAQPRDVAVTAPAANFPIPFPNACFRIIVSPLVISGAGARAAICSAVVTSLAQFTATASYTFVGGTSGTENFSYIAIGC
jgi:hypothetical protein